MAIPEHQAGLLLRQIPSVDELLQEPVIQKLLEAYPRWTVIEAVRETLEERRQKILALLREGIETFVPDLSTLLAQVCRKTLHLARPSLRRVINATGVILHTNLGRAPLSPEALARLHEVAQHYSTLEFDLPRGARGSRQGHIQGLLTRLTGAEGALAVNNNAAAVLLSINTLAEGREVVVSRGELIEIGDSFRIPDVMRKAGAVLREVGTTNRTRLKDYEDAIGERTALLLKVHPSNFRILGFTSDVPLADLVALGRRRALPVMIDMGSGAIADLAPFGLKGEPTVQETLRSEVDLIAFSGDKLLGGPQAGLIVGKKLMIERLRKNPLARAVRIDKLSLAALEATLRAYLEGEKGLGAIPALAMIACPLHEIEQRAERVRAGLQARAHPSVRVTVEEQWSEVGGGALPAQGLPTYCVALQRSEVSPHRLEALLREAEPAVVARIKGEKVLLDMRTVREDEVGLLIGAVGPILADELSS
ncbi:MAG: L-seryl-tRNA(Sec) selenium transferase (Selenocysteine synthase) [candidate division NC10 bacterium CSP1-5]|nr:MAG: L-seryl-tRNA(Sec) selenium transferase (Selenocysteine synthase) [candidate division NC10 bacterium CSP1-5]